MKIFELITNEINSFRFKIYQTYTDKNQFKINYKSEYINKHLTGVYNKLFKHYSFLGCKVQFDADTFFLEESKSDNGFVFKIENFNIFTKKYLESVIEYLVHELTETEITLDSNDKFENLLFEWEVECKQVLIKIYKKILKQI